MRLVLQEERVLQLTPDLRLYVIVFKLLPLGEHKVQGVVLIPESVDIGLAEMGAPLT